MKRRGHEITTAPRRPASEWARLCSGTGMLPVCFYHNTNSNRETDGQDARATTK
jgi:hypothetical protein